MADAGWIAIYAAVIATLNSAWIIYSIYRDKAALTPMVEFGFHGGLSGQSPRQLYIRAINKGRRPITVTACGLHLSDGRRILWVPQVGELPKRLQEGESCYIGVELEKAKADLAERQAKVTGVWARDATDRVHLRRLPKDILNFLNRTA